jgi:hypothetical protein
VTPRIEFRFGSRALGVGIFYHAEKRLLYLHPFPGIALVLHLCKHEWVMPGGFGPRWYHCKKCEADKPREEEHP